MEARHRQWRRWTAISAIGAVVVLAAVVVLRHASAPPPTAPVTSAAPGRVFSQAPYMGVACPVANSIACDRVGLAVWLRRPAVTVSATLAGRPLALNWHGDTPPASAPQHVRAAFDGYLQPAGIVSRLHVAPEAGGRRWYGDGAPSPLVRFRIDYGHGTVVLTQEHVMLAAGWG